MDPRAGLDDVENRTFLTLTGLELRPLRRPARNQSLCRLRIPESISHTHSSHLEDMVILEINYDVSSIADLLVMQL
jgi:hypothetical protein